jgi:hypothetical protein
MAALTYGWSQGERIESVVETAGTDPGTTAKTAVDAADTAIDTAKASVDTAETAVDTVVTSSTAVQGLEGAVISALATLQADGASPTEAHVDTLQTAWDALLTAINTLQTDVTTADTACNTAKTDTDAAVTASQAAQTATDLTVPVDTVEVHVKTGQKALDVIMGLDMIKARVATSKVLAP